jgi:Protein of unknown function (DUF2934)
MNSWDLEDVEKLAYAIWERSGRPEGHSLEHWQEASELIRAQWLAATEDPREHAVRDLRAKGTGA